MPRRSGCKWLLVLLFGGRNPKDPLGSIASLDRQGGSWRLAGALRVARVPWEGRLLVEAIKKRTRLGPLDDQAPSYEVL